MDGDRQVLISVSDKHGSSFRWCGGSSCVCSPCCQQIQSSDYHLLHQDEYKQLHLDESRLGVVGDSLALWTWMEYWGSRLSVDPKVAGNIAVFIEVAGFMDSVVEELGSRDNRFLGIKLAIGSTYDGTKKGSPDEFDFLIQPEMDKTQLRFEHQPLPKTDVQSETKPDFFQARYKGEELKASKWRKDFQRLLRELLQGRAMGGECYHIEVNGPALTFYMFRSDMVRKHALRGAEARTDLIKVDVTLALLVDLEDEAVLSWPPDRANSELKFHRRIIDHGVRSCHAVPYGDFWKLSFARHEGCVIRNMSTEKRNCLVALKHLRDCVSVTRHLEQSTLNSYHLKTAFLCEERRFRDETCWKGRELAKRTVNILNALEGHRVQHPVFDDMTVYSNPHEDRSHLEARRLISFVRAQRQWFTVTLAAACVTMMIYIGVVTIAALMITNVLRVVPGSGLVGGALLEKKPFSLLVEMGDMIWALMFVFGLATLCLFLVPAKLGKVRILLKRPWVSCTLKAIFLLWLFSYIALLVVINPFFPLIDSDFWKQKPSNITSATTIRPPEQASLNDPHQ